MPTPVATWDERVLGSPKWRGYRVTRSLGLLRSEQMRSEPVYLRTARRRPRIVDAEIIMTAAQWAAFETFWRVTLDYGQAWFTMALHTASGAVTGSAHVTDYGPESIGRDWQHVKVTMQLDWIE